MFSIPFEVHAQARPATDADLSAMRSAGIPNPAVGMLWDRNDPNVGQAAGDAKQWLKRFSARHVPVQCFEPEFARKLQAFMSAVPGGVPTITDGYRDPSKQIALVASRASKAGPCQSYHNYGLGADFNNNSGRQTAWMRANARRFGIRTIGQWDPNHFQDARGRFGRCGTCSNYSGSGMTSAPPGATPTFRGASPPLSEPAYDPPVGEPLSPPDDILSSLGTSTASSTTTTSDDPSALDDLREIAHDDEKEKGTFTASSSPPRLSLDAHDVVTLRSRSSTSSASSTMRAQPFAPSQTFVSPDLSETTDREVTFFEEIQTALSALMRILRPLGIRDTIHQVPSLDSEEYYLE